MTDTTAGIDLPQKAQNHIIHLLISDTSFLGQCIRKSLTAEAFPSDVQKNLFNLVVQYYKDHGGAVSDYDLLLDRLTDLIEDPNEPRYKEDQIGEYAAYIEKLQNEVVPTNPQAHYYLDKIEAFIKQRLTTELTNWLLKSKDRKDKTTDIKVEKIKEMAQKLSMASASEDIESLSDLFYTDYETNIASRFGIPWLDRSLGGGLTKGSFVVLLGYTNIGKSWLIAHLAKMAARFGEASLTMANEMSNRTLRQRLNMCMTGLTKTELIKSPKYIRDTISISLVGKSKVLMVSDEEKGSSVSGIPALLDQAREKHSIRPSIILLDSADDMLPPEGEPYRTQLEKSTAIYTWLKNFAKKEDICIVTTTQAQRRGEKIHWLTSATVGDNIKKIQKATVAISINAVGDEIPMGLLRLYLFKHTDGPVGAKVWLRHNFEKGQFVIDSHEFSSRLGYEEYLKERKKEDD